MARPPIGFVLRRGIRGKCPRCGEGALFQRWIVTYDRCSACNLLYQRNYGDIWMFTNIMDRAPILLGVAALFFGFRVYNWWSGVGFLAMMVIPMIATVRHRQGLALALDYLWRVWAKDPSDEIHAAPPSQPAYPGNDDEASGGPARPAALVGPA
ncbi:MAG TPA: hypothetical protein VF883_11305 [Thermoanaerobaculia bacterium]